MSMAKSYREPFGEQARDPTEAPVTTAEVKRLYARPPAFTDLLPWMEYDPDSRTFLLEDGVSVGRLVGDSRRSGSEARTPAFMAQLRDAIQTALTDAIPEEDDAPWILQVYVQDEPSLSALQRDVADYAQPGAAGQRVHTALSDAVCGAPGADQSARWPVP